MSWLFGLVTDTIRWPVAPGVRPDKAPEIAKALPCDPAVLPLVALLPFPLLVAALLVAAVLVVAVPAVPVVLPELPPLVPFPFTLPSPLPGIWKCSPSTSTAVLGW